MLPKALRPSRDWLIGKFNINLSQYYYWLRHPNLNAARREYVKQFYSDDIPDVLMAMKDEALAGNVHAARLFLEYVDEWDKDPRSKDPDERELPIPASEVKVIIYNLQQKFYGKKIEQPEQIENEGEVVSEA